MTLLFRPISLWLSGAPLLVAKQKITSTLKGKKEYINVTWITSRPINTTVGCSNGNQKQRGPIRSQSARSFSLKCWPSLLTSLCAFKLLMDCSFGYCKFGGGCWRSSKVALFSSERVTLQSCNIYGVFRNSIPLEVKAILHPILQKSPSDSSCSNWAHKYILDVFLLRKLP